MKTTIVKSKLNQNFTIISNEILKRTDISLSAKGLYCFIQSLPDDWVVYKNKLTEMTGESRRQINNAFNELEEKGYMISVDVYRKGLKQKEYIFYQFPFNKEQNTATTQNDTPLSTNAQNEQTTTHFEPTTTQNEHLLSTTLVNTILERIKTKTKKGLVDYVFSKEEIKAINKEYKEKLYVKENEDLLLSISASSGKSFDINTLTKFNTHLLVEEKVHLTMGEYQKHFRNWLGKKGNI